MFLDLLEKEDIAASLNATNESIIKRMKKENADLAKQIAEKDEQIRQLREQLQKK